MAFSTSDIVTKSKSCTWSDIGRSQEVFFKGLLNVYDVSLVAVIKFAVTISKLSINVFK